MRISVKVTHLAHDRLILVQILLFAYINKEKLFFLSECWNGRQWGGEKDEWVRQPTGFSVGCFKEGALVMFVLLILLILLILNFISNIVLLLLRK
jgi:hypothetical protein